MLIDRFNTMLAGVVSLPEFAHVKCIGLRNTMAHGAGYKKVWANELHPNGNGVAKAADKFAKVLDQL